MKAGELLSFIADWSAPFEVVHRIYGDGASQKQHQYISKSLKTIVAFGLAEYSEANGTFRAIPNQPNEVK